MDVETRINWFPGHMAKTRRAIAANLKLVDGVVEILDARIPNASRNPDMDSLIGDKPRMFVLNKADMADNAATDRWISCYAKKGFPSVKCNCKTGEGVKSFIPTVRNKLLSELVEKRKAKGVEGMPLRLMVVGIPNVGKSSLINRLAKTKKAKAEDRPGVTRTKQWVKLGENVEMLDMPGILAPKLDDQDAARKLVFTGAVKDTIVDTELLAAFLLEILGRDYPDRLIERYKTDPENIPENGEIPYGYALLEAVGRKRGMLISGGEVDTERAALMLLDEYRGGKLGRITLELP